MKRSMLVFLVMLMLLLLGCQRAERPLAIPAEPSASEQTLPAESIPEAPDPNNAITEVVGIVYVAQDKDGQAVAEPVEVMLESHSAWHLWTAVKENNPLIPSHAYLNSFEIQADTGYLDLDPGIYDANVGSSFEGVMLEAIAGSFLDTYGISQIYITVDGEIYEGGHVYLDFPLVAKSGENGRPEKMDMQIMLEGMMEVQSMTLYRCQDYSIYIPDGQWSLVTMADGNQWTSVYNEQVQLTIRPMKGVSAEQAKETLLQEYPGFSVTEDAGREFYASDETGQMLLTCRLVALEDGFLAVSWTYPLEAAEGFGVRLRYMADTLETE